MFKQITIIGFGLIGSSVARAIRQHNLCEKLVCVDQSDEVGIVAKVHMLADEVTTDIGQGVKDSDLVIVCTPVGTIRDVAKAMAPHLKDGAIVSDVGSVKKQVCDAFCEELPNTIHVVPAHPIAGTENSGPEAGFAELFINRWCIITPPANTDVRAIEKVVQLWEVFQSRTEIMDADHHDLVLGITSHLPHLIAYTIVGTASDLEDDIKSEVVKFSASGFRDFTRIAASNPIMWRDVFLNNKDAVLEVLQRFSEDLTALQRAIRKGDGEYLYQTFTKTRNIRRDIIEAGQADYVYPNQKEVGVPPVSGQRKAVAD